MKGYLTVFLSLSLSILTGFILLLIGAAVRNGCKIRLECGTDTAMNAVLSEYHAGLLERYDLLYVDASYLSREPSADNIRQRFWYYLAENTERPMSGRQSPWGELTLQEAEILSYDTAAAGAGSSMKSQAVRYVQESMDANHDLVLCRELVQEAAQNISKIERLDQENPMEEWRTLMEQLAGMELPRIQNQKGIWEEVPLSNPADWVFALGESHILYLAEADIDSISIAQINLQTLLSHRQIIGTEEARNYREDQELFLIYILEKMGSLKNAREASLLQCQLEYLIVGEPSDWLNTNGAAQRLFRWRFADNLSKALADGGLYAQALSAAEQLTAVQLKNEFQEPVAKSILYACAFLESIGDLRIIYSGGRIPVLKEGHSMQVERLLSGTLYHTESEDGLNYEQYLICMLFLMENRQLNLRVLDIMEMDIRSLDQNPYFSMDWCVERLRVSVAADISYGPPCYLERKYGYY